MLQESLDHLKSSGFEVERTTTGYAKSKVVHLYIGKEECEVIQKVGKILEIRILDCMYANNPKYLSQTFKEGVQLLGRS